MFFWNKEAVPVTKELIEELKYKKDYKKIIKLIRSELKKGRQSDYFYCSLAEAIEETQKKPNLHDLTELYTNALKLNKRNSLAYYKRALIKMKQSLLQDAIKDLSAAIQINPKDAKSHTELGNIKFKYAKFKEAIECYDSALKFDPEYIPALVARAKANLELEMYELAITDLSQAIALNSEDISILILRGDARFKTDDFSEEQKPTLRKRILILPFRITNQYCR